MDNKVMVRNRTKIVCTIGPASSSQGILNEMITAGMDVARINFSHGDGDSNLLLIEKIRAAAKEVGRSVAILQDLQGPKIRVGQLPPEGLELKDDDFVSLKAGTEEYIDGKIPVPYINLAKDLRRGDSILLDDGTKELEVLGIDGATIHTKVILGGRLISYKGLNVPTRTLSVESITEKDIEDLALGLKQNIDFVALSFVRTAEDVRDLKAKIDKFLPADVEPPGIIVKIEKHEALENFDAILAEADGVMIARGDLGLETAATKVPIHQKDLIARSLLAGKPVITATEMLASMEIKPRPTRAEVSDVANAVIDHTDAVMLSGESAMGRFPVRAVKTMAEIVHHTEESPLDNLIPHQENTDESVPIAVGAAASVLARHIQASAILVTTASGYSARAVASFRPEIPLFAATSSTRTRNQLFLSWGVTPFMVEGYEKPEKMVKDSLKILTDVYMMKKGDKVVVVSGLKKDKGVYDSAIRVVEL